MKNFCAFISAVVLFFLIILPGSTVQAADNEKSIYLVTWRGFEEGCEGFKEYLDTRGLKYKLIHRDANRDKKTFPAFVEEIRRIKPDLVVTWGTSVSVGILGKYDDVNPEKHITDIPAVFMFPSNPQRSKLVENYQSSGRNIAGVRYVLTEEQQLGVAMESMVFTKFGMLENVDEINVVNSIKAMRKAADTAGIQVLVEDVESSKEAAVMQARFIAALQKLKSRGAEVIYFTPSSLLNAHSDLFTQTALDLKLPIFSSGQNPVRHGKAAVGLGVSYRQTGKRAAVLAEKILQGTRPADLSIDAPEEFGVVINMSVVNALGVKISPDILSIAEIVQN